MKCGPSLPAVWTQSRSSAALKLTVSAILYPSTSHYTCLRQQDPVGRNGRNPWPPTLILPLIRTLSPIFHHHRIDWSGHTNTLPPPYRTRHLSPKCFAEARTKIPANSNQAVMNRAMLKYQQGMQTECKFRRQENNDTTHITSRVLYDTSGLYWRDSCTGMWASDYKKEKLHHD